MEQPSFWYQKGTLKETLLKPIGFLYGYIVGWRLRHAKPYTPKIPVICVGNICIGGTGKTPMCLALADYFVRRGKNVFFLSHGYKSHLQNVMIDVRTHTAADVSDEALIFAQKLPTIVDKNRAEGVRRAESLGAEILIMDDGFQNPTVKKKCAFVVFNGVKGIGNGSCLPAGPLRETLKNGLKRATAAVIVGKDEQGLEKMIQTLYPKLPILKGHVEPTQDLKNLKGIAFAGIGYPEKFFKMLEKYGVKLSEKISFPDHYAYTRKDIENLIAKNKPLFTTMKDAVKIDEDLRAKLTIIEIDFIFDEPEKWDAVLERKIKW